MLLKGRPIEHQLERISAQRTHKCKRMEYFLLSSHSFPENLHSNFQASQVLIVRLYSTSTTLSRQGGMDGLTGLPNHQMT